MPRERLRKLSLFSVLTIVGFMIAQTVAGICQECVRVEVPDPGGGSASWHVICLDGFDVGWYFCTDGAEPVQWCVTKLFCAGPIVFSTEGPIDHAGSGHCIEPVGPSDMEEIPGEAGPEGERAAPPPEKREPAIDPSTP